MARQTRYTRHALRRMRRRGVTESMVESVLTNHYVAEAGEESIRYDGVVDGRVLSVAVELGSEPPLIMTVFWERRRGASR